MSKLPIVSTIRGNRLLRWVLLTVLIDFLQFGIHFDCMPPAWFALAVGAIPAAGLSGFLLFLFAAGSSSVPGGISGLLSDVLTALLIGFVILGGGALWLSCHVC